MVQLPPTPTSHSTLKEMQLSFPKMGVNTQRINQRHLRTPQMDEQRHSIHNNRHINIQIDPHG